MNYGIRFDDLKNGKLVGYADANWASDIDTRRSIQDKYISQTQVRCHGTLNVNRQLQNQAQKQNTAKHLLVQTAMFSYKLKNLAK